MALIVCTECGKTFSDKANCCPECGCPTKYLFNTSKKNYSYLGKDIHVKESVDIYLELCKKLKIMAREARNNLEAHEFLKGKNHLQDMAEIVLTPVKNGVSLTVECLDRLGFCITEENFYLEEEDSFSAMQYALEVYENKYSLLIQEIAGKEAYRNFRKAVRGRFAGGGSGIDGMIKGALTSAVANAVVGAGYTMANIIGNVGTRIKVDRKAIELSENFRNLFLKEELIESTLKNIELSFLKKCSEFDSGNFMQEYDTNHNNYNADPCLMDIANREKKLRTYLILLESVPYCPIIYKTLLLEFGDEKGELAKLAKKYDVDIDRIKKEILNN